MSNSVRIPVSGKVFVFEDSRFDAEPRQDASVDIRPGTEGVLNAVVVTVAALNGSFIAALTPDEARAIGFTLMLAGSVVAGRGQ